MTAKALPAVLGGDPVIAPADQQPWPPVGTIESAVLGEITDHDQWVGYANHPAKWRAILEQVVADTTGYRYGVGQPNGTLAIASGPRCGPPRPSARCGSSKRHVYNPLAP